LWKEAGLLAAAVGAILFVATLQAGLSGVAARAAPSIDQVRAPIASPTPRQPTGIVDGWTHGLPLGQSFQSFDAAKPESNRPIPSPAARTTPTMTPSAIVSPDMPPPAPGSTPFGALLGGPGALGTSVPATVRQWESLIVKYAAENDLDPNLVAAVIMTESGGNSQATSKKGAIGLMQIVNGPYDPEENVRDGTRILADRLRRYGGDLELGLAAYNAGVGAVDRSGGIPSYGETETYIFVVLNRYYLYAAI
jgi:soluble lytic murein transglycosylase-like protein